LLQHESLNAQKRLEKKSISLFEFNWIAFLTLVIKQGIFDNGLTKFKQRIRFFFFVFISQLVLRLLKVAMDTEFCALSLSANFGRLSAEKWKFTRKRSVENVENMCQRGMEVSLTEVKPDLF
jgi:hypothetical protein